MRHLFFLAVVFLINVLSATDPIADPMFDCWQELKRKITVAEIDAGIKERTIDVIDEISHHAKAKYIYAHIQRISDLNVLIQAVMAIGEAPKKKKVKEARVWEILDGIDEHAYPQAATAIASALVSDRLVVARSWRYLANIEEEWRNQAVEAVNAGLRERRTGIGYRWSLLTSCIADGRVLNFAIKAMNLAPEKEKLKTVDVWLCIASIKKPGDRSNAIKAVNKAKSIQTKLNAAREWLKGDEDDS